MAIVTYLLPIVGAELERRRLAIYITTLGRTPHEILLRAWNGSSFGKLPDHLVALTLPMLEVGQGHLAYPVLHCIHNSTRETALALGGRHTVEPRDRAAVGDLGFVAVFSLFSRRRGCTYLRGSQGVSECPSKQSKPLTLLRFMVSLVSMKSHPVPSA